MDLASSRASPATVNPETRAPAPVASAVGGRRVGSAAPGSGLERPAERSLHRPPGSPASPPLNYVKQAPEPASLRRHPGSPAPNPSPQAPRWPGSPPVTREEAGTAATRPSRRP